jgi:hypothetical protein
VNCIILKFIFIFNAYYFIYLYSSVGNNVDYMLRRQKVFLLKNLKIYTPPFLFKLLKKFSNQTELNTSSPRQTELFDYFCIFFLKSSVWFDRTGLQNELDMMHSDDKDHKIYSVDHFALTKFFTKKQKNNQKTRKTWVRFD